MVIKVGINGPGRVGKGTWAALERHYLDTVVVMAVNSRSMNAERLVPYLTLDSVHGRFPSKVELENGYLMVGGNKVEVLNYEDPDKIPWSDLGVQIVLESTGAFKYKAQYMSHIINGGAERAIVTCPLEDDGAPTVVLGVNDEPSVLEQKAISMASCTTNAWAPLIKVLDDAFGIQYGVMTATHARTASQDLLDSTGKYTDGRNRSASSTLPYKTGASETIYKLFPHLKGKLSANCNRVSLDDGSYLDFDVFLDQKATVQDVNKAMTESSETDLKGILNVENLPNMISADIVRDTHSATVLTRQTRQTFDLPNAIHIGALYDNEAGYNQRVAEMIYAMAKHLGS